MRTLELFPAMPKYHVTPETEEIYEAFPRKVGRPDAMTAIRSAVKKHGFQHVLKRTKEFAEAWQRSGQPLAFVPYPGTFFRQERYNDDYAVMFPEHRATAVKPSVPIWQQCKAVENLLELNARALGKIQMPEVGKYVNGADNNRYKADLQKAISERNSLREEKRQLVAKLQELQRKLIA